MSFDMRAKPFDLDDNAVRWVNDTFNDMTQEEKIAQLFVDMLWNDTGKQTAAVLGRYPSGGLRSITASPGNCTDKTRRHKKTAESRCSSQPMWRRAVTVQ